MQTVINSSNITQDNVKNYTTVVFAYFASSTVDYKLKFSVRNLHVMHTQAHDFQTFGEPNNNIIVAIFKDDPFPTDEMNR